MFRRIIVGIDGSRIAVLLFQHSPRRAVLLRWTGQPFLQSAWLIAMPEIVRAGPGFNDAAAQNRTTRAMGCAALARAHYLFIPTNLAGETSLLDVDDTGIAELLLRQSKAWGADLMVPGKHGRRGV